MSAIRHGSVAVVGGGIGGIQAALDLADSGFYVYLIEDGPAIGGRMAQLDKTFPTNDCAMCMLSPKLVEVGRHPNVQILTLASVESLDGQPGNFQTHDSAAPSLRRHRSMYRVRALCRVMRLSRAQIPQRV
jgi:heterodisulfide reductase subunit A